MRYTIVGDLHIKPDNLDKHSELFGIIEELGNPVILLGDLLHTKELVRSRCFNFLFEKLQNSSLQFICLVGNHDWHNLECKEHSLSPLKALPNVKVIDECTAIKAGSKTLVFLPYAHRTEDFNSLLSQVRDYRPSVLFMHQGITGFDYGNGYIAEHEADFDSLKGLNRVISGHFHKFQEKQQLTYLGTPFSQDFGEANQEKFIAIYETETDEIEYLKTEFPSHRSLTLSAENASKHLNQQLNKVDYFRCILTGTPEEIAEFDKSKFQGVKFIERPSLIKQTSGVISESDSNSKKFRKWGKEVKQLPEPIVELGLKYLQEAE